MLKRRVGKVRQKSLSGQKLERKRTYKKKKTSFLAVATLVVFTTSVMINAIASSEKTSDNNWPNEMIAVLPSEDNWTLGSSAYTKKIKRIK